MTIHLVVQILQVFAALAFFHFLADFPLQGDFISASKNFRHPWKQSDGTFISWQYMLTVHASIHAGFVYLVTGSWALCLIELIDHWSTDYSRCEGRFSFEKDQSIHLASKLLYAVIAVLCSMHSPLLPH